MDALIKQLTWIGEDLKSLQQSGHSGAIIIHTWGSLGRIIVGTNQNHFIVTSSGEATWQTANYVHSWVLIKQKVCMICDRSAGLSLAVFILGYALSVQ